MIRLHSRSVFSLCIACLFAVALFGCGSDNNTTNGQSTSQVRVFNGFVPSAGTNGNISATSGSTSLTGSGGLGFGQFSTTPASVSSGTFNPQVTGQAFATPLQLQTPGNLAANNSYTLAVVGQQGQTGINAPQTLLIPNYTPAGTVIPNGQAALRVINLSPGTDPLGLYSTVGAGQPTLLNTSLNNINYGYNSNVNNFAFVPAGTPANLSFQSATNPGTNLPINGNSLSNITFQSGQAYTIFTYGQPNNAAQSFNATVVQNSTFFHP